MSVSQTDIAAIPNYTPAEQLRCWQAASVEVALGGQSYAVQGKSLTRSDTNLIIKMISFWQQQVNAASGDGDTALVQFGEAQ